MRVAGRAAAGWEAVAVVIVTLIGAGLRFSDFGLAPQFGDNLDEIQFSWAGLNLLAHGDAYTWSFFPVYPRPVATLHAYGVTFPMVHHWMDHPPGFSLLLGAWLWLTGSHDMLSLTPERVRALPVAGAVLTIPLAYLVGRRALGRRPALAGAALLATAPGAVLLSRQAEPESVLAPLLLAATLLADGLPPAGVELGRGARGRLAGLLAIAAVAPTLKVTGLAVGGIAAVILVARGRSRPAVAIVAATIAGGLLYPLYGRVVDWPLFLAVVHQQSLNRVGMMAGYEFLVAPAGVNRALRDGWWVLGWIGIGYLALRGRHARAQLLLAWPALAYGLAIMLLAGQDLAARYGWYRLILVPQVMLAAGALAWRGAAQPSPAALAAVFLLGGSTALNWTLAGSSPEWVVDPVVGVVVLAVLILPAAATAAPRVAGYRVVARGLAFAALAVLLLGNVAESLELPALLGGL